MQTRAGIVLVLGVAMLAACGEPGARRSNRADGGTHVAPNEGTLGIDLDLEWEARGFTTDRLPDFEWLRRYQVNVKNRAVPVFDFDAASVVLITDENVAIGAAVIRDGYNRSLLPGAEEPLVVRATVKVDDVITAIRFTFGGEYREVSVPALSSDVSSCYALLEINPVATMECLPGSRSVSSSACPNESAMASCNPAADPPGTSPKCEEELREAETECLRTIACYLGAGTTACSQNINLGSPDIVAACSSQERQRAAAMTSQGLCRLAVADDCRIAIREHILTCAGY